MNVFGSYKNLRDNAIAAAIAAIEIYNKPKMDYRSECFIILLGNAWELLFKAILSKNRVRLFYPKKRKEKYRTLTLYDAMKACEKFFPPSIQYKPVAENIDAITILRNDAIHFYNEKDFQILIYGLAQTSVVNFRDITASIFAHDISDEINLALLPLSFATPPDPIQFLKKDTAGKSAVVAEFIALIASRTKELEAAQLDTGRFLTVFTISLQSTKKIASADITAAINELSPDATVVTKAVDPNKSHPLLRKHALQKIGKQIHGMPFTSNTFEAVAWVDKLKENSRFYWKPFEGGTSQYSNEIVQYMKGLTKTKLEECVAKYGEKFKRGRKKKK